jgi:hypothetical protein
MKAQIEAGDRQNKEEESNTYIELSSALSHITVID